jgi:23S rRNA (guanine2445-N2)-methyltransferase / 23S rRNA (guanine2069-N7)-methyltransferase
VSPLLQFFATCAPGLEAVLHAEIRDLGLKGVERQVGGVRFTGGMPDAWRANLHLRTAVRVLLRLARFEARDADALYAGAKAVDWSRFLGPSGTLVVDAHAKESALDHTLFVEQRVKDAVADAFRERHGGARPSVDKEAPDLAIHAHLFRDRCTLLADTSGESLHKRGWRRFQGRAPLAETLAAAVVLLSGWDRRSPLLDPFCGSGTILVEAALIAGGIAPGLFRGRFAFEGWPGHDAAAWRALREAASRAGGAIPPKLVLRGSDADPAAIDDARENLAAAGLAGRVALEVADARDFAPRRGWNALVATNPPYGERVGSDRDLVELYARFGDALREHAGGYRYAILSGGLRSLDTALGLSPETTIELRNGAIECRLLVGEVPRPASP